MPRVELPIVAPFTIPALEWTVTDIRSLGSVGQSETENRWTKAVIDYAATIQIDHRDVLCENVIPKQNQEFHLRLAKAQVADQSLSAEAYTRAHPLKRLRFHTGIESSGSVLSVSHQDRVIGGIHVAVYVVESDTPQKLTATSMLWLAVEPRLGMAEIDVNVAAITYMLKNDLELEDGRALDFIGYDQTSDIPMSEWGPERAPLLAFYDRLAVDFDRSTDPITGDFRFRRRGVTARPASRL